MNNHAAPIDRQRAYLELALSQAKKSPPGPTNFCVGAVLVNETADQVLTTGYTLELPDADTEFASSDVLVIYTTMEPCNMRASGNLPCVDRILQARLGDAQQKIAKVYVGVQEPETFVEPNTGKARLESAGMAYIHVTGLEHEILATATAGHER